MQVMFPMKYGLNANGTIVLLGLRRFQKMLFWLSQKELMS